MAAQRMRKRPSSKAKHHVKEEHTEMFPEVRKTQLDLRALGDQLQQRKDELSSATSDVEPIRRAARAIGNAISP